MKHKNAANRLNNKYFYIVCLFLVVATLAAYWQVLDNDFVNYDDDKYVTDNISVHKGVTFDSLTWAFTSTSVSNWHPLTWISHMIDCQFYGLTPRGHHLTNLLFHLANTLLLLLVLVRMTGALWQSSFVAALFALHPLHVESVAWVAERKDVLSTFFMLLTVWAYLLYVKKGKIKRYLLVVLFFALGLMSKPMLVSLPFILLMLDFWPLGRLCLIHDTRDIVTGQQTNERLNIFRLLWEKVPFFALAVASCVITFIVQEKAMEPLKAYSLQTRIINAFVVYIEYIVNMIWPVKLTVLYPHPGNSLPHWLGVAAGVALISITTLVVCKARKVPYITVGWLWYIVTLIPVIGIVQVGWQAMADRYTYTTLIGLFVIIAWGANDLLSKLPHRKMWLGTLAAILFPVLIVLTWKQVQYWENSITLYQHTLKHTSNNHVIHYNVGVAFDDQDRTEEAIEHYLQALRIRPDYDAAHNNLGTILNKQGRTEEAVKHFQQALRITPDFVEVHYNLANTFCKLDRTEESIDHYLQALRLEPDFESAHYNLGNVFDRQDRTEEAIEHYLQALRINPDSFKAHNNLGTVFYKLDRTEEAIEHFLQAQRIKPDDATARNNHGAALIRKGNINEAIKVFREALRVNPDNVDTKNNLKKVLLMQQKNK